MNPVRNGPEPRILSSWKQIAAYLGLGIRTVQRYEQKLGLPVRRPAARSRSSVIAFPDDLDSWLRRAPMRRRQNRANGVICPLCSGTGILAPQETALDQPAELLMIRAAG